MDELAQIIHENLKTAPPQIRALALGNDVSLCVASITARRNLDETDSVVIRNAALLVLGNVLPPHELSRHLEEVLSFPPSIARDIAEELDVKLFAKVRPQLDLLFADLVSEKKAGTNLPVPPPPPPGARRIISSREVMSVQRPPVPQPLQKVSTPLPSPTTKPSQPSNPPSISSRPIIPRSQFPEPPPPVPPSSALQTQGQPLGRSISPLPPPNLPVEQPPIKKSPFNTPGLATSVRGPALKNEQSKSALFSRSPLVTEHSPVDDILLAKLSGNVEARNDEHTPGISPAKEVIPHSYTTVDPYRELPE